MLTLGQRWQPGKAAAAVKASHCFLTARAVEAPRTLTLLHRARFDAHAPVQTIIGVRTRPTDHGLERIALQRFARTLVPLYSVDAHKTSRVGVH
ncbi:hypothetical protein BpHYR1_005946 [Brachionus plicatilis]|uniref:Uncharacterized protein n=1 Tax=Brachionus plicatilis TaxID=10195 RepID=A0A3M7SRG7_BRAPC|nr:hypothetical protein BpHYR1_005946 [Brachionus plicatilis]